jgi:nitrite reductase (NADH) large subunit
MERTSEWAARVGLDTIKKALEKKEDRDALNSRIDHTLGLTQDPWKQIIENDELRSAFDALTAPVHAEAAAAVTSNGSKDQNV